MTASEAQIDNGEKIGNGRNVLIIHGPDNLGEAQKILEDNNFPYGLAVRLLNGDYEGLVFKSGPEEKVWPEENPVENFVEYILKTDAGDTERSLCHFDGITTSSAQRDGKNWTFLDTEVRLSEPEYKFPPVEIICVTAGSGAMYFPDAVIEKRGEIKGKLVNLEPGTIIVSTVGVGNAFSYIGEKGLDFIYISRPPYEEVTTTRVNPQTVTA